MPVDAFNALPREEAIALLLTCARVTRWAEEVADARPFGTRDELLAAAEHSARRWTAAELDEALAGHPRIGEHPGGSDPEAAFSRAEQSGVPDDHATRERIATGNAVYERRFGRVFLVRAAGRGPEQILAELERRLDHDPMAEIPVALAELRDIALRRLETSL
ncbi:OHCU decarboxylase [Aeromicrobium sp. PE09-221]|uniref:2-oxo-4-hydroxy-4-carboxy-5-ureidoimidazoline decarboxylase n=1 Tax=Aeromicrobium sp. PE09-221 TaxID=1898043 RepID=UPI000B3E8A7F|nr:2-oxo-4-hydroxy-4-carboxy-5-ureidoimidazoline decarboxylase [Aeromicrobium sp. PE09-221]OUZ07074.1 OHCU decarboxylase [Aeromicrobium sp. PE09-221]